MRAAQCVQYGFCLLLASLSLSEDTLRDARTGARSPVSPWDASRQKQPPVGAYSKFVSVSPIALIVSFIDTTDIKCALAVNKNEFQRPHGYRAALVRAPASGSL